MLVYPAANELNRTPQNDGDDNYQSRTYISGGQRPGEITAPRMSTSTRSLSWHNPTNTTTYTRSHAPPTISTETPRLQPTPRATTGMRIQTPIQSSSSSPIGIPLPPMTARLSTAQPQSQRNIKPPLHPETGKPLYTYEHNTISFALPMRRAETDIDIPMEEETEANAQDQRDVMGDEYYNHAGNLPALWEDIELQGVKERKNDMRGTLSPSLFYTRHNNTVYAGSSARTASLAELSRPGSYNHAQDHPVYFAAPRGLPRTPSEARNLIELIRDTKVTGSHRIEAYYLVLEVLSLGHRVSRGMRDRTMHWVLDHSDFHPEVDKPHLPVSEWPTEGPSRDFSSILNSDRMVSVPLPRIESGMLNIDAYAEYILFHHYPGSNHYQYGLVFDQMRRTNRSAAFTHYLIRLLCPSRDRTVRRRFTFFFTLVAAIPHRYHEAIDAHNQSHPSQPFAEQKGPIYHIRPANIAPEQLDTLDVNVIHTILIDNGIPPTWIDTAYTFSLRAFDQAYRNKSLSIKFLNSLDDDRLERLQRFGEPLPISHASGWKSPTPLDALRLTYSFQHVYDSSGAHPASSPEWITTGVKPSYHLLKNRDYEQDTGTTDVQTDNTIPTTTTNSNSSTPVDDRSHIQTSYRVPRHNAERRGRSASPRIIRRTEQRF